MKKYIKFILILFFIFLEIYVLFNSKNVIDEFSYTLKICLYSLMPTMFSSILISKILIELNFEKYIPKFIINSISKLFKINDKESSIFLLSILSGYPNNSKMLIDNPNLNKIILFSNHVNPLFLICTVGGIYLKNIYLALIIYLSHIISSIILGIIIRRKKSYCVTKKENKVNKNFFEIYFSSLKDTSLTLVNIFSNILFFSILISLLKNILIFNPITNYFIIGIFEFSAGINLICSLKISYFLKCIFILIIITFGSFSIHMQMISINPKIKYTKYLLYRILNVFISIIIFIFLFKVYNLILY